jgi:DNA-binding MarR family transcriptional regulator
VTRQWTPYMELRPDVLAFIDTFSTEHGYPPVNLEIATRFGYSRAWASMFLDRLERDGLIVRSRETGVTRKRTIRLTGSGRREARKGMGDGDGPGGQGRRRRSLAARPQPRS